ncbi:MAG: complex I NDUFA9 subunit family protein [Aquificae bacterium]|nr:complex I NDUFA9 subunit family protein [Aquificota bacterium]
MKIFITGATGFVGRYLVGDLKEKNELIIPVRNVKKAEAILGTYPTIKYIKFNENLYSLVKETKPDVIINLLGILTENKENTYEKVHVEYTKQLVNGAMEVGFIKFLQMSALGADKNSKSRYAKTKAIAEEYVINSGLNYIIYRPSIILGREQKLFSDLKKFSKIAPFFLAPKGKVQPVHILDVKDAFIKGLDKDLKNKIYELCGPKIISYKELFKFALKTVGIKKPVIEVPVSVFYILQPFFSLFPEPPITKDQLYLLEKDNVCLKGNGGIKELLGVYRDPFRIFN